MLSANHISIGWAGGKKSKVLRDSNMGVTVSHGHAVSQGEIRMFDWGKSSGVDKSRHKTLLFLPPALGRIRISPAGAEYFHKT